MKKLKPTVPILIISAAMERPDGLEVSDRFLAKGSRLRSCSIPWLISWLGKERGTIARYMCVSDADKPLPAGMRNHRVRT
jgi:hypothetical protein